MRHELRTKIVCIAAVLFGAIITTLLFVRFGITPMGETFHWVSFDGVETWGTRADILPLAVGAVLATVVFGALSLIAVVKKNESRALAFSAVLAVSATLLLLAGLRFL